MTRIWWCQEHDSSFQLEADPNPPTWGCWYTADANIEWECRPVPMRLIPDNDEVSAMLSQVRGEEVEYQPGYFVWQMEADIRDAFVVALIGETP